MVTIATTIIGRTSPAIRRERDGAAVVISFDVTVGSSRWPNGPHELVTRSAIKSSRHTAHLSRGLDVFDTDRSGEGVTFRRGEGDAIFESICSFDTQHVPKTLVVEVRHGTCLSGPGIPNDRGSAASLCDTYAARKNGVVHRAVAGGIEKNAVDFAFDFRRSGFALSGEVLDFV